MAILVEIVGILVLATLGLVYYMVEKAEEGWEDAEGFHRGKKPK